MAMLVAKAWRQGVWAGLHLDRLVPECVGATIASNPPGLLPALAAYSRAPSMSCYLPRTFVEECSCPLQGQPKPVGRTSIGWKNGDVLALALAFWSGPYS
jgi:hypothetical protein